MLTPVFSISVAPITVTGTAVEPAAIGIKEPVTTKLSSLVIAGVVVVGAVWARAVAVASAASATNRQARRGERRVGWLLVFMVWLF